MALLFGLRQMRRTPVFTATLVFTLGLGIGVNTAIFSLIDTVVLKRLPVRDPGRLVFFSDKLDQGWISGSGPVGKWDYFSSPFFEYVAEKDTPVAGISAFQRQVMSLSARIEGQGLSTQAERVNGRLVSGNFFSVLGLDALRGRTLMEGDDRPTAAPVAVISYDYWTRRFDRSPQILGRTVALNGSPFTIIGVTPPEFLDVMLTNSVPDLWLPLSAQPAVMQGASYLLDNHVFWLNLLGRLRSNINVSVAQASLNVLLRQFLTMQPEASASQRALDEIRHSYITLSPGERGLSWLREGFRQPLLALMGIVGLLLLVACVNIANMLLASAAYRQREMATRLALGAGRGQLLRQLLTESLVIAVLGGTLGLILAAQGTRTIAFFAGVNTTVDVLPNRSVLAFTAFVSILTVVLFGLAPSIGGSRVEVASALRVSGFGVHLPRRGTTRSRGLIVAQVALSMPMLIGAGVLLRTLANLEHLRDVAVREPQRHVLFVEIDARSGGYRPDQLLGFYLGLLNKVKALPGVASCSLASYAPMKGTSLDNDISFEGYAPSRGQDMRAWDVAVASGYFETEGMRLLAGRLFGPGDTPNSPKVAVVTAEFGRHFFPDGNPIGRYFSQGTPFEKPGTQIVGVVEDTRFNTDFRRQAPRMIFVPVPQLTGDSLFLSPYLNDLEIRSWRDPKAIIGEVRSLFAQEYRDVPVLGITTPVDLADGSRSLSNTRGLSRLAAAFGLLGLVLVCTGLYGVTSYNVARRVPEIGLRMSLGATPSDVLQLMLGKGLVLAVAGIMIGLPIALISTRMIASQLFGVEPYDPLTVSVTIMLVLLVSSIACGIPARRAMKVSPMAALRQE